MKIAGTVKSVQPISHGDARLGTTTMLRTVKVVQTDGSNLSVPHVSGNSLRGRLRRISADLWWKAAGNPQLLPEQFRVIYQGGSLNKSQKKISSQQVAEIRETNPHLALFGFSGSGRIVQGKSYISGLMLICKETTNVTGINTDKSFWDYLDVMNFSRMEDTTRSVNQKTIHPLENVFDEDSGQMRFATQVIAAGTPMTFSAQLADPTPSEREWFQLVIKAWADEGAAVGGRASAGMGKLDISGLEGTDLDVKPFHSLKSFQNETKVKETLSWLNG